MARRGPISEQVRKAIADSGQSRYRISKETGIDAAVLNRFIHRQQSLKLSTVDTLGEFLGLDIVVRSIAAGGVAARNSAQKQNIRAVLSGKAIEKRGS
jgi:ribosome-binding protein aMBF1 (putative translation factor)